MTTTSQYGLGGAQYRSGSIMGVTHDAIDNRLIQWEQKWQQ